jgi:F0F1-type ATP synthase delta subunit
VGLALDGKITTSYNLSDNDLNEIKKEVEQLKGRIIFFKSVYISSE